MKLPAILALLPVIAFASLPQSKSVRGDGAMTCATFMAGTARPSVDIQQVNWTLGYLTAVEATGVALRPVSDSYVRGWIGGYCERNAANQAANIDTATRELIASLKK